MLKNGENNLYFFKIVEVAEVRKKTIITLLLAIYIVLTRGDFFFFTKLARNMNYKI